MFTQKYLLDTFIYDSESGIIRWKNDRYCGPNKSALKVKAGEIAGTISHFGYRVISISYKKYMAHRIAFMMVNGYCPSTLDHINGDRLDNRIINIRKCTQSQNCHNSKLSKRNSSGLKNVSWNTQNSKWYAIVRKNGKAVFAGSYKNMNDAVNAARELRLKLHGEFANHGDTK